MLYENAIKIVTKEPYLLIAKFGLDSQYRSRSEILDIIKENMDFSSKKELGKNHPYFNTCSLKDSFNGTLSSLVEGDEEKGYRIKVNELEFLSKVNLGIQTTIATGISLDHVFRGPSSAENVAEILYSLRNGDRKRIQDICNEMGMQLSIPGRHLARLSELGIVRFQGYEPPKYGWNSEEKSFSGVEKDIVKKLERFSPSDYRVQRAIEIARRLYDNKGKEFNLTEVERLIEHRFSSGKSNRGLTAGGLRNLQRMGYINASNFFVYRDTLSEVSALFDKGQNHFINFIMAIKGEIVVPDLRIGWKDAIEAIYIYDENYVRKKSPELRKQQICEFLREKGRATKKKIEKHVKCNIFKYLKQLEKTGIVSYEKVLNTHYYFLS